MDVDAFDRRAHLAGVHPPAAGRERGCLGYVDIAIDHEGVLAAEFEEAWDEPRTRGATDLAPGGDRAGEVDEPDERVLYECGSNLTVSEHDVDDAGGKDVEQWAEGRH